MPTALSQILISSIIAELEDNDDFAALSESQQIAVLNSAQQEVCDLFNAAAKKDYRSTTLAGATWPVTGKHIYLADAVQAAAANPVATIVTNSLAGAIAWTRTEAGIYVGTLAAAFPAGKVGFNVHGRFTADNMPIPMDCYRTSDNTVQLVTFGADDWTGQIGIEVYV